MLHVGGAINSDMTDCAQYTDGYGKYTDLISSHKCDQAENMLQCVHVHTYHDVYCACYNAYMYIHTMMYIVHVTMRTRYMYIHTMMYIVHVTMRTCTYIP